MAFFYSEQEVDCCRCGKKAHGVAMRFTTRHSSDFIDLCAKCVGKIDTAIAKNALRRAQEEVANA